MPPRIRTLASFPPHFLSLSEKFSLHFASPDAFPLRLPFASRGAAIHFRQQYYMFRQLLDIPHIRSVVEKLSFSLSELPDGRAELIVEIHRGAQELLAALDAQISFTSGTSIPPSSPSVIPAPAPADSPLDTDEGFLAFMGGPETLPKTEQEQPK